jgi:uncharacterized protein
VKNLAEQDRLIPWLDLYMRYGGYPEVVLSPKIEDKQLILRNIIQAQIYKDIAEAGIERSDRYLLILKLLAHQTGGILNMHELGNTLNMPVSSIDNYITVMRKTYHITTLKPFFTNVRKELTKMPKVFFYDLGLRNSLLGNFESLAERIDA